MELCSSTIYTADGCLTGQRRSKISDIYVCLIKAKIKHCTCKFELKSWYDYWRRLQTVHGSSLALGGLLCVLLLEEFPLAFEFLHDGAAAGLGDVAAVDELV